VIEEGGVAVRGAAWAGAAKDAMSATRRIRRDMVVVLWER
jgi:hypothetical protein